jgi:small subunit ribosomal protein S17
MFKKKFNGVVIGKVSKKTISVVVQKVIKHKLYSKILIKTKKYLVHDEHNCFNEGDKIEIMHHKPISKKKTLDNCKQDKIMIQVGTNLNVIDNTGVKIDGELKVLGNFVFEPSFSPFYICKYN